MTDYYPYQFEPIPPPAPQLVPPPPTPSRHRGLLIGFGSGALAAALVVGGVALANTGGSSTIVGSGSLSRLAPVTPGGTGTGGTTPSGGTTGGSTTPNGAGTATATQQIGIVTVVSTLQYQSAQSAGTGMVLSAAGEILTNNHVINGATSITVTVESTGKSYRADVVGTAPASDVAVLKLRNASGLTKANLASSASGVQVGDAVVGVGNAGGTGTLTSAAGKVTALNQSITASDEGGQDAERLTGLIEIDAKIIAGDSGGPLYDSAGEIIGIDTAASVSRGAASAAAASAYAIPIETATGIAGQIEAGVETTSIHLGLPGFLGVSTQAAAGAGAGVAGLLAGGPAAAAGITAGSTITAVDGNAVTSPQTLRARLVGHDPGTKVTVTWTNQAGTSRSATVTLGTGPAD